MNQDEYMKERVDNQIDWYDKKSTLNQKWYKILQVIAIISASTIPFLSGFISGNNFKIRICIGVLGLLVAVITSIFSLYKFQEHWLEYRNTCESLRHEKYLFLTKTIPYNTDEAFSTFVQSVELLISKENTNWLKHMKKANKKSNI